jgi:D-aminopeptidase
MICHGFKGGIGTASRIVPDGQGGYAVGVLVQANHGARERLQIEGVRVGRELGPDRIPVAGLARPPGGGSIIVVVATDAPLLPHQLHRLAQRAGLGVARLGGAGENGSGDIFIAFSTANRGLAGGGTRSVEMLGNDAINPLFYATIEATEEAIVNALLQAETMTGRGGATAHRLDPELLAELVGHARTG